MALVFTGKEAGLSTKDQIRLALGEIVTRGGKATMQQIIFAVELDIGAELSRQGRASLRRCVNHNAVRLGFVKPHNPKKPGWTITQEGREWLHEQKVQSEMMKRSS